MDENTNTPAPQPLRYVIYLADGTLDGCYMQVPPEAHAARMIAVDEVIAADWVHYRANGARDGVEPQPAPTPDPAALEAAAVAAYEASVQKHMDDTAWLYGYDSALTAISYAEEPAVPAFQTEGQAFRAWRSLVWAQCRDVLAQYQAGSIQAPTIDGLIASLPALDLPAPALGRTVQ
jgi:hypothetical protein